MEHLLRPDVVPCRAYKDALETGLAVLGLSLMQTTSVHRGPGCSVFGSRFPREAEPAGRAWTEKEVY